MSTVPTEERSIAFFATGFAVLHFVALGEGLVPLLYQCQVFLFHHGKSSFLTESALIAVVFCLQVLVYYGALP